MNLKKDFSIYWKSEYVYHTEYKHTSLPIIVVCYAKENGKPYYDWYVDFPDRVDVWVSELKGKHPRHVEEKEISLILLKYCGL
jgi:hypothetical protein